MPCTKRKPTVRLSPQWEPWNVRGTDPNRRGVSVGMKLERGTGSARKGPLCVVGFHVKCVTYRGTWSRQLGSHGNWSLEVGEEDEGDAGQAAEESSGALGSHSPVLSPGGTGAGAA